MFDNVEVVYAYTRKQAIQDGVLIDVTKTAKEAGFKYPVAITEGVWNGYIVPPAGVVDDTEGRLWDVLFMAGIIIRSTKNPPNPMLFKVGFRTKNGFKETKLKIHCGPGDQGEPVITIMLPHED